MYAKVYVEITNICNRNCSFCIGTNRPLRRMTLEEFSLVTDKLSGYTKYLYYHLMGEPTGHPLLPEFIKLTGEKGFRSIVTTNGTLLNQVGDKLLAAGLHKVNISIHSFEDGNEEDHRKYLLDCCRFAKKAAAMGTITVFRLWNEGVDEGKNSIAEAAIGEFFGDEWAEERRGIRLHDRIYLEYGQRFSWPDLEAEDMGENVYCYGLKDQFGILADGTVVPCCLDHNGDLGLGNIFEEELSDILNNPRAETIRSGFKNRKVTEELCRKCGYARRF